MRIERDSSLVRHNTVLNRKKRSKQLTEFFPFAIPLPVYHAPPHVAAFPVHARERHLAWEA